MQFVRLHLGNENETVAKHEIDCSWVEAARVLLRFKDPDREYIESVLQKDETTLALLFFHLHFHFIHKAREPIDPCCDGADSEPE